MAEIPPTRWRESVKLKVSARMHTVNTLLNAYYKRPINPNDICTHEAVVSARKKVDGLGYWMHAVSYVPANTPCVTKIKQAVTKDSSYDALGRLTPEATNEIFWAIYDDIPDV